MSLRRFRPSTISPAASAPSLGARAARRACVRRSGFTLLELLLVIVIIAMLVALMFPALNAAREYGRRASCMNKLRELGRAVATFEDSKQRYPGWFEYPLHMQGSGPNPPRTGVSWVAGVLPYIERNDVYEQLRESSRTNFATAGVERPTGFTPPNMPDKLVCPSNPAMLNQTQVPALSYIANCGRVDNRQPAGTPAPSDWRTNAVFLDLSDTNLQLRGFRKQDADFIRKGDGLSSTLLLSEDRRDNPDAPSGYGWYDVYSWPDRGEASTGFVFFTPADAAWNLNVVRINGDPGDGTSAYHFARPSSHHVRGVNVIFADTHGQFLSDSIDYHVYCALMTPLGEKATEPGSSDPSPAAIRNPPPLAGQY